MAGSEANPFVGPRPFESGERLYGRDRELDELYYLFAAERIVLLHSPSGAGKSSLVQAGLVPRLQRRFDVWRPTRVGQEPPVEETSRGAGNRYALSALKGFDEGIPEELRSSVEELAGLTLAEYFEARPRRPSAPENVALIFDQFEEVLTADPLAVDAKRQFFDQLGELLRNPRVWALLVLREDYLAPLDPYARRVPTHLKNRFRLDLLGLDGAREAMVNPARAGGRDFPAAERLARDLAVVQVQQADGSFRQQTGRHVEPVQLQVVCRRLWDAMPAGKRVIEAGDLEHFGDVDRALSAYYEDSVRRIAAGDASLERALRDFFDQRLITAGGLRGQVRRGAETSGGLGNEVVARLRDTHLVRAEKRAGATWYELAHDRLLAPVREANEAWRAEHLSEAQHRAQVWQSEGRPPDLLLLGEKLVAARRWAAEAEAVTPVEARFLKESEAAQEVADRERRQARRIRRLAIVASVVGAVALVAGVFAAVQWRKAVAQQARANLEAERANLEAESAKRVSDFMVELFKESREDAAKGNTISAREIIDRGAEKVQESLDDQPLVRARMMDAIAQAYLNLGLLEEAESLLEEALEVREREGAGDVEVGSSLHYLGNVLWRRGRLDEAEPLLRRALELRERAFGPRHPEVAKTLKGLADLVRHRGLHARAEPLYQRAIALQEEILGPHHVELAATLGDLGALRREQGRFEEAEPLLRRSVAIWEESLGPDHWGLYAFLANLALGYIEQGRFEEAEPIARHMLALTEKALGPDHWATGSSVQQLAGVFIAQGRYAEAAPLVERALQVADGQPPGYFEWLVWLAGHYHARGRDADAEPLFRRALAAFEEEGPETQMVAWVLRGLARVLRGQERGAEAEELYRRALAILEGHPEFQGPDMIPGEAAGPELIKVLKDYAVLLRSLGRDAEAEELERRAAAMAPVDAE